MKNTSLSNPRRMILTELLSDLGEQFVHLTVLAELFFGLAASQANLLLICLIQQAPAILLGPVAGRWVDRIGPHNGIVGSNLVRLLLVVGLLLARGQWRVWPIYFLFAIASLVFVISRLYITPCIVTPKELIGYNTLNERVALAGRVCDRTLLVSCFALVGVGFTLLTVLPWLALFAIVMACLGCLFTLLAMFLTSRIQRDCAESRRGEILAGLTALSSICLLAGLCMGALTEKVGGVRLLLSLGAGLSMAAMLVACGLSCMPGAREGDDPGI